MAAQRITVTGADGFVGRRLVKRLKGAGYIVQGLGRRSEIDLADDRQVEKLNISADIIIHLAARIYVPDSFLNPCEFYRTNVMGTVHMLEVARRTGARFILASAYVYGRPTQLPIPEDHELVAHSPYAETKIIAERIFRNYHASFGVSGTILRPFNIYGPGQDSRFLMPSMIAQIPSGKLTLQSSRPRRDYVYVDDVVEAYLKAVEREDSVLEAINIASGQSWSVRAVAELVKSIHGQPLDIAYAEDERVNEIADTRADISKAEKFLDWSPTVGLEEGLRKTMAGALGESI